MKSIRCMMGFHRLGRGAWGRTPSFGDLLPPLIFTCELCCDRMVVAHPERFSAPVNIGPATDDFFDDPVLLAQGKMLDDAIREIEACGPQEGLPR